MGWDCKSREKWKSRTNRWSIVRYNLNTHTVQLSEADISPVNCHFSYFTEELIKMWNTVLYHSCNIQDLIGPFSFYIFSFSLIQSYWLFWLFVEKSKPAANHTAGQSPIILTNSFTSFIFFQNEKQSTIYPTHLIQSLWLWSISKNSWILLVTKNLKIFFIRGKLV